MCIVYARAFPPLQRSLSALPPPLEEFTMRRSLERLSVAALLLLGACASGAQSATASAKRSEWRTLFDGATTSAWRGYKADTMPSGWMVANGTLGKLKATGDIISREQFADFEFYFCTTC